MSTCPVYPTSQTRSGQGLSALKWKISNYVYVVGGLNQSGLNQSVWHCCFLLNILMKMSFDSEVRFCSIFFLFDQFFIGKSDYSMVGILFLRLLTRWAETIPFVFGSDLKKAYMWRTLGTGSQI